jgi:3-hydroxyisobutyrate dehydrogenase-like beta-hydroxyacid dehydrogenase
VDIGFVGLGKMELPMVVKPLEAAAGVIVDGRRH